MQPYYESDRGLAEYLLFHYGTAGEILPYTFGPTDALDYAVRCVSQCLDPASLGPEPRALDLGCAVGRSTFELSRVCSRVIGIDFSSRFIESAETLRNTGSIEYAYTEEGSLTRPARASLPEGINADRVSFETGDAMDLRADLGSFDVVLMANLIDRLTDPRRCLDRLPALVKPGGQLIISSPYTWLEEYTPQTNWPGGFYCGGTPVRTRDGLSQILGQEFESMGFKDLPFLIREHARKFQWSVAEASVWKRR